MNSGMEGAWAGDAELVRLVNTTFRPRRPAAVAAVSSEGELTATAGVGDEATFEIGSISKAITGMLYRDATERGLVSPTTTLREPLPLRDHREVGSVTLESLATHRSGLPSLPPGMHPLRRNVAFLLKGANPLATHSTNSWNRRGTCVSVPGGDGAEGGQAEPAVEAQVGIGGGLGQAGGVGGVELRESGRDDRRPKPGT